MARRITYTPNRVIDSNGIADGASIFVYLTGTTTLVPIYSDAGLTSSLTNPYVVASGAAVPTIYHNQTGDVRIKVVNDGGSTVSDDDPAPTSPIDLITLADAALAATLAASEDAQVSSDEAAASASLAQTAAASAVSVSQAASDALALGTISDLVGTRIYTSRAALDADLVPADNLYALVVGDATASNNDLYQKNGATTAGSWDGPLGIFAAASASAQAQAAIATAQAILATTEADVAQANALLYDRLLDEFPTESRQTSAALSNAPLLVGYDDGFELDFTRSYERIAAVKQSGVLTFAAPDEYLAVTNTSLPTITKSSGATGLPPHNLFINSATPVVGDSPVNLTVGQEYRITMLGAGSLTIIRPLTSGGASIGTATEAAPLVFTALDNRIRISAVTGVVTRIQMQRSSADDIYLASGASERYGVAISKRPVSGEMCLMVDPAANQLIVAALSGIPALGGEWLLYFDCYLEAAGDSSGYLLNFENGSGLANYFSLRSDGLVNLQVASSSLIANTPPKAPVSATRFQFVARVKNQAVVFASQGNPSGNQGTWKVSTFTPTNFHVGNRFGGTLPGKLHVRRIALLPVA